MPEAFSKCVISIIDLTELPVTIMSTFVEDCMIGETVTIVGGSIREEVVLLVTWI